MPFKDGDAPLQFSKKLAGTYLNKEYTKSEKNKMLNMGKFVTQNRTSKKYDLTNFSVAPTSIEKGD